MAEIDVTLVSDDQLIDVPLATVFGTGIASIEQTVTSEDPDIPNEITCALTNGVQTKFYIRNGDGDSPTITVEQAAEGYEITIVDKDGVHTSSILVDSTLDADSANPIQNQAVAGAVTQLTSDISAEVTRATDAESAIRTEASQTYATQTALSNLQTTLHNEVTGEYARATAVEEVLRATGTNNATAISNLQTSVGEAVKYTTQSLTDAQQTQARSNISVPSVSQLTTVSGNLSALSNDAVRISAQSLTEAQKAQVRSNIGVTGGGGGDGIFWVTYNSTTATEIDNALADGLLPVLAWTDQYSSNKRYCPLVKATSTQYVFVAVIEDEEYMYVLVNGTWTRSTYSLLSDGSTTYSTALKQIFRTNIGAITASEAPVQSVNGLTGAVTIPTATTSADGLMSSTDKSRLDALYADYSSALSALGVS